jgi:hypothetical protein
MIGFPMFAFLRSSANWEEADLFWPERFLEKDAEISRKVGGTDELSAKPNDFTDKATGHITSTLSNSELDRYHPSSSRESHPPGIIYF